MEFAWRLRKGSKKEACPQCGQKRFVPYVSAKDGITRAGEAYGRCDRETSCGYHLYPSKSVPKLTGVAKEVRVVEPLRFYPSAIKIGFSSLFSFFAHWIGEAEAVAIWKEYKVCATSDGRTTFWQIDKGGEVRAGKAIKYKADGHRDKSAIPPVSWCHKLREFAGLHQGEELRQCFFGEHLLTAYPDREVAIVESEKTAMFMSYFFPRFVWLASGGSQNLKNADKHTPLIGRKVMLVPDNGQYNNWLEIAIKHGYNITDVMERYTPFIGADVLDVMTEKEIEL